MKELPKIIIGILIAVITFLVGGDIKESQYLKRVEQLEINAAEVLVELKYINRNLEQLNKNYNGK